MKSPIYPFLLNMYMMKRIDGDYLEVMVIKGNITKEEKEMILATP